jgi:hypothetical protein
MTSLLGDQLSYHPYMFGTTIFPSLLRTTQIRNIFSHITNGVIIFFGKFSPFEKNILKNNIPAEIPCFLIFKTFSIL